MLKPDSLKIALEDSAKSADPKLVFVVKDLQHDEPYVGSVSIARSILLEGNLGESYKMWITLFDDINDDEYDGAMGISDDESPRVLVEFTLSEAA